MKTLMAFLALAVLLALTSCGKEEVEVTREVEVTPVFDAEAEKKALIANMNESRDAAAKGDREIRLAGLAEDWRIVVATTWDFWRVWTPQDMSPDWWTEPEIWRWVDDDYDLFVSPGLAVFRGEYTMQGPEGESFLYYATAVQIKEDGEWKILNFHMSPLEP